MDRFKHTVSSLKRFNKGLKRSVRQQERRLLAMQKLAKENRDLIDKSASLAEKIVQFDPWLATEEKAS